MKIGIIGLGVVGSAVKHGLEKIGHAVVSYDIKYPDTSVKDVLDTEICFVCVPTHTTVDGQCDISIVESVLQELDRHSYQGVVAIKSTVIPGTIDSLSKKFKLRLAFCPEFLRERAAFTDFAEDHDLCIIGSHDDKSYELIEEAHGSLPKQFHRLTPKEAEFAKYFSNVFNALRIIFANEFYDVCKAAGVNYQKVKDAVVKKKTMTNVYLDCNENFRGFGGICLPKDTHAFATFAKQLNPEAQLFELIVERNKKLTKTVFKGMRDGVIPASEVIIPKEELA